MRLLIAATLASLALLGQAIAADFASSYSVVGDNPGGGQYTGKVTVKRTGPATYQIVWTVGGEKYVGTGIGGVDGLAVSYKAGASTGVAILGAGAGGEINGVWTYAGGTEVGKETWTPN